MLMYVKNNNRLGKVKSSRNMLSFCLIACAIFHIGGASFEGYHNAVVNEFIVPEGIDHNESTILLDRMDNAFEFLNRMIANLEWQSLRNMSVVTSELYTYVFQLKQTLKSRWCTALIDLQGTRVYINKRLLRFLCNGLKYTNEMARKIVNYSKLLSSVYDLTQICKFEDHKKRCYNGELDVGKLMATSRNEKELRWAWTAWRNHMSYTRNIFKKLVDFQNTVAQNNGYADIGVYWREEFEIPNLENFLEKMYEQIKPLYRLLHAVVRYRLAATYPEVVDTLLPIPAHLLGNLWSQSWENIIDIVFPNYTAVMPNLMESMKDSNYSVMKMIKQTEDFYISLGFPSLPSKFWKNSIFEQKSGSRSSCHASAVNMYKKDDFRIFACLETKPQDFDIIHHEIGHIQYYMAYQNQPSFFKNGINTAFHEAIGDTVAYGATSLRHMQRLKLIRNAFTSSANTSQKNSHPFTNLEESLGIVILLRQALLRIPQLSNGLIIEKWRWSVFSGRIKPSKYNTSWWNLHRQYMGIVPPSPRSEDFFDPAAKFHIAHNIPYIGYFLGNLLQVQLFQGMCKASQGSSLKIDSVPFNLSLYKCDIYGSRNAGKFLRSVMKLGSNVDYKYALRVMTGYADYRVEPFLHYYELIRDWLQHEIERYNIPIGWN